MPSAHHFKAVLISCLLLVALVALSSARDSTRALAATTATFTALPVSAVAPANGQLATPTTVVQAKLNTTSPTWTSGLTAAFKDGDYALRLANTSTGAIIWFVPFGGKSAAYMLTTLTVSNAISFNAATGVVTVTPPPLALGSGYTAILAVGSAALTLAAQDFGYTIALPAGSLCCAYGAPGTPAWAFSISSVAATSKSATSGTSTGIATVSLAGATTNAGTATLTASATGVGQVTAAAFLGTPTAPTSFTPSGAYFDLSVSLGSTFQQLTVNWCKGGAALYWYTGSAWQRVSAQKWTNGCLSTTLSSGSSPTLSQLSGTVLAGALPTISAVSPNTSVPGGGSPVEITGTALSGVTSIQFGLAAVPTLPSASTPAFSVVSDSTIQVWDTPPGTGAVDVTVTTPGGSGSMAGAFSFTAAPPTQHAAIPAYFAPGSPWSTLDAAAPTVGMAVINPFNGPTTSCNYAQQIQTSQAAGVGVLGYVYTRYANTLADTSGAFDKTVAEVESEIDLYYTCYPSIDGIFFDETSTDCTYATSYYAVLSSYLKGKGGKATAAINPGSASNECYMGAADIMVSFEGTFAAYELYSPAAWTSKYPANRFWHLIHTVPDAASSISAVNKSRANGAAWVFATSALAAQGSNTWGSLPSNPIWVDELWAIHPAAPVVGAVSPTSGSVAGGTSVTVSGSSFSGLTSVCFASTCTSAAGLTVSPDRTSIQLSTPAASTAGVVAITVTNSAGTVTRPNVFTYTAPQASSNLLLNGDFSAGSQSWTPTCNTWGSSGGTAWPLAHCGSFFSTGTQGVTLDATNTPYDAPYIGMAQVIPVSSAAVLTGTVTVNSMSECSIDNAVWVSITLLDAQQNPVVPTDQFLGNIALGHHPYISGCSPYVYASSPTFFYQDMPNWTAGSGAQRFAIPIGSIVSARLSGVTAAQVSYVRVQLMDYADTGRPNVTFGKLNLQSATTVNVVTDAGATGNGASDDTAAFTRALGALATGSQPGILYVPAATYVIQPSMLVVKDNVFVDGPGATLKAAATGFEMVELQGANPVIQGVTFEGANLVVRGVSVQPGASNVLLSHVTVRDITQPADPTATTYYQDPVGIRVYGDSNTVQIDTSSVLNVVATHPDCATATCTRVARGILISPGTASTIAKNVKIEYSSVTEVAPKDDGDCLVIQDSDDTANLSVLHNSFDRCHKRAIKIQVPGAYVAFNNIDNPFLNDNFTDPSFGYAQSQFPYDMFSAISAYKSNVTLVGNTISGTGSFYNGVELGTGTCTAVGSETVQANTIHMGSTAYITGASSIRMMSPVQGVTISGNTLDTAQTGITIYPGSTGVTIDGTNTFVHISTPTTTYGTCS